MHRLLAHVHSPCALEGNTRTRSGTASVPQHLTNPPARSQGAYLHAPLTPVAQFARHSPAMEGYWNTLSQSLEVVDRTRSRRRRASGYQLLRAVSESLSFTILLTASLI